MIEMLLLPTNIATSVFSFKHSLLMNAERMKGEKAGRAVKLEHVGVGVLRPFIVVEVEICPEFRAGSGKVGSLLDGGNTSVVVVVVFTRHYDKLKT